MAVEWFNSTILRGQGQGYHNMSLKLEERQKLDRLFGVALVDNRTCDRLLRFDDALLNEFNLCGDTQAWLRTFRAGSLNELAEAIVFGAGQ